MTESGPNVDVALSADFSRDGFVRLPGLLNTETTSALLSAVELATVGQEDNELSRDAMRFASNIFRRSPELQRFLSSPVVLSLVHTLLGPGAWVRWDQAVWKGPGAPEFPLHQDNGYTGLAHAHLQLWVALTSMSRDHGALVVVPGAHRRLFDHRWDGTHAVTEVPGERLLIEAKAGDVVAFSSFLPHATGCNTTDSTRVAYVAEFLPLEVEDRGVTTPRFVSSIGGRPCGRFIADTEWPTDRARSGVSR